eukprot:COSAG01_NODE_9292_length_2492_cov_3.570832_4_plen_56_part_00
MDFLTLDRVSAAIWKTCIDEVIRGVADLTNAATTTSGGGGGGMPLRKTVSRVISV